MPEKLSESVSGSTELVFPDSVTEKEYSLRELAVYGADEVRSEMEHETDIPQYGNWLPVTLGTGDEAWLVAPSQLRKKLVEQDASPSERFLIPSMEKQGRDPSDPYQVEIVFPDRQKPDSQAGLSDVTETS
jgi:hypothetical protein